MRAQGRVARSQGPGAGRRIWLGLGLVVAAGIATIALPTALRAQEEPVGLARGATVPPVQLADLAGQAVDLGQVIGHKPVLVEFWATWCSNCAALEPRMQAAFRRHAGQVEFVVVAVGVNQTLASVQRHVAQHALPASHVLWDGNGAAVRAFQAPATSYLVVLDRQGKVTYTGVGPDQDIEAALARVGH